MKISEKQALMMLDILKESLNIVGGFGGYDIKTRQQLVNDIMNQQSNNVKELEPKKKYFKKKDDGPAY